MKLTAPSAFGITFTRPRYVLLPWPAEMPLEMMRLDVFFPMCVIFVPVSACWRPLASATE